MRTANMTSTEARNRVELGPEAENTVTKRIKARLQRYTALLREIDNQMERLDRIEATMTAPSGSDFSGMPRGGGLPTDRTGMWVIRKMELEDKIQCTLKAERRENAALEEMIEQVENPDGRAVIRMRYLDRAEWDEITSVLFGACADYIDRLEYYQHRTYKIHGRALCELAAIFGSCEGVGRAGD